MVVVIYHQSLRSVGHQLFKYNNNNNNYFTNKNEVDP